MGNVSNRRYFEQDRHKLAIGICVLARLNGGMKTPAVALVTGAGKGIGREVARLLVEKGLEVWVAARNAGQAAEVAESLGPQAHAVTLDVTHEGSVQAAAAEVEQRSGRLDVLINNAAILLDRADDIAGVPVEVLRHTLETNVLGVWRVIQAFLPLLEKSAAPRIVNVSSGAGQLSDPGSWAPAYSVSKTALNGVTTQLAVARPQMAVNAVSPGWCRTDMGGAGATKSAVEGADSIVWLAVESPQSLTGKFVADRREMAW